MKNKKRIFCEIFLAVFFLCCASLEASTVKLREPSLGYSQAQRYVLPNGMVVITKTVRGSPVVALEMVVKAGSATEGRYEGSGISHFLEHMVFKGTQQRGVGEIEREIKSCGGTISGFTSFDYTGYSVAVPSEYFDHGLDILADALMHCALYSDELEKERKVILNEFRLKQDEPHYLLLRLLWSTVYSVHLYRHPIIGYQDLFQRLRREDLLEYYHRMYVPHNMVLAVVGDIDQTKVKDKIENAFRDFQRQSLDPPFTPPEPLQMDQRRIQEYFDVELAHLGIGFHSSSVRDGDLYSLDVLAIILGQGESSKLNQAVRHERGLVYSIEASNYTLRDPGMFVISAIGEGDKVEDAINSVLSELDKVKKGCLSHEEIEKAKRKVLASYLFERETVEGQAMDLALNEALVGNYNFSQRYVDAINEMGEEDILRAARNYLHRTNMTIATILPIEGKSSEPYIHSEDEEPTDIYKNVLPNGVTVLLKPDHRLPLVSIVAVFKGGVRVETEKNNGVCNLTAKTLLKGTRSRNSQEIAELVESWGGEISSFSGNNSFGVTLEILSEDLFQGLELLSDILRRPAFPSKEIEREKREALAYIRSQEEDVFQTASRVLRETLFFSHPYRFQPIGREQSVRGIRREDIVEFYHHWGVPNNMVLAIFGDIEKERTLKEIERQFGKFVRKEPIDLVVPKEGAIDQKREIAERLPRKQSVISLGFHGVTVDDEDRYILDLISSILSGRDGRLATHIREKLALAYALGAYSVPGIDPGYYVLYIVTSAEDSERAKEELLQQIESLKTALVSDEEIELAKRSVIGRRTIEWQSNSTLAFEVALDELYGLGYDQYTRYESKIKSIAKEDILRAAEKYFDSERCAVVTIMPEADEATDVTD